jgi:succinate dehydrogenase/fumarate reductase flavoprotein subunit
MDYQALKTDILILGSGGAGLFAALHAKQANPDLDVTIAVKGLLGKCGCTRMVQGGYNVALSPGDSVERHFMDTINGGKWLPDQDMAMRLCQTLRPHRAQGRPHRHRNHQPPDGTGARVTGEHDGRTPRAGIVAVA